MQCESRDNHEGHRGPVRIPDRQEHEQDEERTREQVKPDLSAIHPPSAGDGIPAFAYQIERGIDHKEQEQRGGQEENSTECPRNTPHHPTDKAGLAEIQRQLLRMEVSGHEERGIQRKEPLAEVDEPARCAPLSKPAAGLGFCVTFHAC